MSLSQISFGYANGHRHILTTFVAVHVIAHRTYLEGQQQTTNLARTLCLVRRR